MSVKRKKRSVLFRWKKSFSILTPWSSGKANREAVLEREVVLTKMKLLTNFPCRFFPHLDSPSVADAAIACLPESNEETLDPGLKPESPGTVRDSDFLSSMSSNSQRLCKFEWEDSGVELPSGSNSPSNTAGSQQSLAFHSRESSCDSGTLSPDSHSLSHKLASIARSCQIIQEKDSVDSHADPQEVHFPSETTEPDLQEELSQSATSQASLGGRGDSTEIRKTSVAPDRTSPNARRSQSGESVIDQTGTDSDLLPIRRRRTSDGLEEYMDECCRLSEAWQPSDPVISNLMTCDPLTSDPVTSDPVTSGLDYLQQVCRLIERLGHLTEDNLRLQRRVSVLESSGRRRDAKEAFFQQHCRCGAAYLAYQQVLGIPEDVQSGSGRQWERSVIPEIRQGEGGGRSAVTPSPPRRRRRIHRRSFPEWGMGLLLDSKDCSTLPQCQRSESYSWSRVKDLMTRATWRKQYRLTASPLKTSCPQLYRSDLGHLDSLRTNRTSMLSLGLHTRQELSWLD